MAVVVGLVTCVELDGANSDARRMSVSARLEAQLSDGSRLVLLDGRGWGASVAGSGTDIRAWLSADEIESTARSVVGPDEPYDGQTYRQAAAAHWGALADVLGRRTGVGTTGRELERLPHDVVLGDRLRAWLVPPEGTSAS